MLFNRAPATDTQNGEAHLDFKGEKGEVSHVEQAPEGDLRLKEGHGNEFLEDLRDVRIEMTDEQSRLVCRKIDTVILVILAWIYFLQILDKSTIGYAAIFGLAADSHLVGNQYSLVSSCGYWAQMAWQPFSAYLIVKVPTKILLPSTVFLWGLAMCGMAASNNYSSLLATRFLLGLFEASCLPIFSLVTSIWWRRSEQPLRVAVWYATNGIATMFGSALSFGLGKIHSEKLHSYQIIFLFVGLMTVITAPLVYFRLDNKPGDAKFLTPEERGWAVERLRDNNTGAGTSSFKTDQVLECFLSPKTWLFVAMAFCVNCASSTYATFGPIILAGFGFEKSITILLNIPFGFLQVILILIGSFAATRYKYKSPFLALLCLPCIAGAAMLYAIPRGASHSAPLLAAYYMLAFLFVGNPLLISWINATTGGQSKKSVTISLYQCGVTAGNIVGPLLFKAKDAPEYLPGILGALGAFVGFLGCVGLQVINIYILNKLKERQRVKNGKPAKLHDRSMELKYVSALKDEREHVENSVDEPDVEGAAGKKGLQLGSNGLKDISDGKNDEFVYVY